jgi:hypothetical protein
MNRLISAATLMMVAATGVAWATTDTIILGKDNVIRYGGTVDIKPNRKLRIKAGETVKNYGTIKLGADSILESTDMNTKAYIKNIDSSVYGLDITPIEGARPIGQYANITGGLYQVEANAKTQKVGDLVGPNISDGAYTITNESVEIDQANESTTSNDVFEALSSAANILSNENNALVFASEEENEPVEVVLNSDLSIAAAIGNVANPDTAKKYPQALIIKGQKDYEEDGESGGTLTLSGNNTFFTNSKDVLITNKAIVRFNNATQSFFPNTVIEINGKSTVTVVSDGDDVIRRDNSNHIRVNGSSILDLSDAKFEVGNGVIITVGTDDDDELDD